MLTTEPAGSGWQVTLRSTGPLRFFASAFLGVWLGGWAMGEWFALRFLATLLRGLLHARALERWLPSFGGSLPPGPVSIAFVAFLLFWLTFWTIGGAGAVLRVLTLLFGSEVVWWDEKMLEVERRAGPLRTRVRLDPQEITGFRRLRGNLMADGHRGPTSVASLGGEADRAQLMALLQQWHAANVPAVFRSPDESPVKDYVVVRDDNGALALAPAAGAARTTGVLLAVLGAVFAGSVGAATTQKTGAGLVASMIVLGLLAAACCYGSAWLLFGSLRWLPGANRIERRRALFGRVWSVEITPLELVLESAWDADGDGRWALLACGGGRRLTIMSAIDDPSGPLALGEWLAARTGVPLSKRGDTGLLRRAS